MAVNILLSNEKTAYFFDGNPKHKNTGQISLKQYDRQQTIIFTKICYG